MLRKSSCNSIENKYTHTSTHTYCPYGILLFYVTPHIFDVDIDCFPVFLTQESIGSGPGLCFFVQVRMFDSLVCLRVLFEPNGSSSISMDQTWQQREYAIVLIVYFTYTHTHKYPPLHIHTLSIYKYVCTFLLNWMHSCLCVLDRRSAALNPVWIPFVCLCLCPCLSFYFDFYYSFVYGSLFRLTLIFCDVNGKFADNLLGFFLSLLWMNMWLIVQWHSNNCYFIIVTWIADRSI